MHKPVVVLVSILSANHVYVDMEPFSRPLSFSTFVVHSGVSVPFVQFPKSTNVSQKRVTKNPICSGLNKLCPPLHRKST
jgi:hypothetical protein